MKARVLELPHRNLARVDKPCSIMAKNEETKNPKNHANALGIDRNPH